MNDSLPPLNALRAFDAAARHLSFKRAAEELNVTPAAIGHQVRQLEDHLGVALFRRLNRAVILTEAGQAAFPDLRDGFDLVVSAVERIRTADLRSVLVANVAPSLAVKWLVPRLPRFQAAHPEITVRVEMSVGPPGNGWENFDIAVRYTDEVAPGLIGEALLGEEIAPVCAPQLLEGPNGLRTPSDLRHFTLIHLEGPSYDPAQPDWRRWLRAAGVEGVVPRGGLRFDHTLTAAQSAIDGAGVALLSQTCLLDDLAAGRLVRPFDLGFKGTYAYRVISPRGVFDQPKVTAFRQWLQAEAEACRAQVDALRRGKAEHAVDRLGSSPGASMR